MGVGKKMLRFRLRNTILSPAMFIAIVGLYLSMVVSVWPFANCDLLYNYQYTISLGFTAFFIPVASVLPFCNFQHLLTTGKSTQFCLIRSKKSSYVFSTCISAVTSGMIVMVGAFVLFTITCLAYSPSGTAYIGNGLFTYSNTFYAPLMRRPLALYLLMGGIFAINGAMWPMVSMLCFAFTSNLYLAISVPFITRTLMGYLTQLLGLYVLDPAQLLLKGVAMQWPGGGIPYLLLYTGVAALLCGGVWTIGEYRRLRYG